MTRRSASGALGGILVFCAAVAGCGVPTSSMAQSVPVVPYDLLSPSGSDPSARPSVPGTGPQVWLVRDDALVPSAAPSSGADVRSTASAVLLRLAEGPTEQQRADGLATAFGPDVQLVLTEVAGRRAVVDIRAGDQAPSPSRLPLAVGQLVLTLTSIDGVDEVVLTAGGAPIGAPLPGGALTERPLRADDYAALRSSRSRPPRLTRTDGHGVGIADPVTVPGHAVGPGSSWLPTPPRAPASTTESWSRRRCTAGPALGRRARGPGRRSHRRWT